MARYEVIMPKMGESIIEATITKWLKDEGDAISEEDVIVEIATDKVDSEIPSPVDGKLIKRLFKEGDTVEVGKVIAIIAMEGEGDDDTAEITEVATAIKEGKIDDANMIEGNGFVMHQKNDNEGSADADYKGSVRFYSPLVKSIAKEENISLKELDSIIGTGRDGRLTKHDLLDYISEKKSGNLPAKHAESSSDIQKIPVPLCEIQSIKYG